MHMESYLVLIIFMRRVRCHASTEFATFLILCRQLCFHLVTPPKYHYYRVPLILSEISISNAYYSSLSARELLLFSYRAQTVHFKSFCRVNKKHLPRITIKSAQLCKSGKRALCSMLILRAGEHLPPCLSLGNRRRGHAGVHSTTALQGCS